MELTARQRRLYARHLLLPEIGKAGQKQLCSARVVPSADADHRAYCAAATYLERAGVAAVLVPEEASPDSLPQVYSLSLPSPDQVRALAGDPELEDAAALLGGSFAAVEAIKAVVGVGDHEPCSPDVVLAVDPEGEGS